MTTHKFIYFSLMECLGILIVFSILSPYLMLVYSHYNQMTLLIINMVASPIFSGWIAGYYYEKKYGEFVNYKVLLQALLPIFIAHTVMIAMLVFTVFNDIDGFNFKDSYIYALFQVIIMNFSVVLFGRLVNSAIKTQK